MTNEQINIAIFEIFGWKWEPEKNSFFHSENGRLKPKYAPDYCNDLNAMREAEMTLSREVRNHYIDLLGDIYSDSWEFATATAMQRAEAFLKTLGKWEK
jgi:hypothetical protein